MGDVPDWYRVIKAAKYLEVPPWDLAVKPLAWIEMAEATQSAEAHADMIRENARAKQT